MTVLILISAFMLINLYLISIAGKFKTRKSISDSDYWLQKPWKWTFEFVISYCALSLAYTSYVLDSWFMAFGAIGILMVAIFSRFKKNQFFNISHVTGAVGGFLLSILSFGIDLKRWDLTIFIVLIFGIVSYTSKDNDNKTWNVEISLIYGLFGCLLWYLLS